MRYTNLQRRLRPLLGAALAVALAGGQAAAVDNFWNAGAGSWTVDDNWLNPLSNESFTPDAEFEEVAIINNGGVVTLNSSAPDVGGIVLGQAEGDSGTLIIETGGSLNLVATNGAATEIPPIGTANIALDGDALLEVYGGASFSTTLLDINNTGTVRIGTSGAGAASVTSTGGFFSDGTIEIQGPGHTFTVAGNATFEGGSRYSPILTSSTPTVLSAVGSVTLGGTLALGTNGYSPSPSDSYLLLEGSSIEGDFDNFDTSGLPDPGPGRVYQTSVVDGGAGQQLFFGLQTLATLKVNSDTGAVSLVSESGEGIEMVGYSILSGSGLLNTGAWNSLEDQSTTGWEEASPTANALSELNFNLGSLTLTASEQGIGTPYAAPATFGVAPDLVFQYATTDSGAPILGIVEYTGSKAANNLLLTVDPDTGEAELRNSSEFTLDLRGYSILSDSGSLVPGDGAWESLEDQGQSGWEEANPTSLSLSELLPEGFATLGPGVAYGLGDLFNTGGARDLSLQFLLDGESAPRDGIVLYDEITPPIPGDYNNDGAVNAADYTVWRDGNSPDSSQAGYILWRDNYGATAGGASAAAAVPEPAAIIAMVMGVAAAATHRRRVAQPNAAG